MNNTMFRAACAALALLSAACSSDPNKLPPDNPFKHNQVSARELRAEVSTLYKAARASLDSGDYSSALLRYDQIAARYPFTDFATQADLERIYCLYRSFEPEKALSAADKFLREHPRHPAVDYVQYLKGLINFDREDSFAGFLGLDTTKEDVSYSRRSFDDFALLVQKYPNSRFNADARQRMIYLRNRLAEHEMHIVRYYVKRGALLAAAKRAEQVVAQYPGTPASLEALRVIEDNYRELGLNQQAEDAMKLRIAQAAVLPPEQKKEPGFFGRLFGS